MLRTSNPALNERTFSPTFQIPQSRAAIGTSGVDVMTLNGAVNKSLIAVAITFLAAAWSWNNPNLIMQPGISIGIMVGTFVVALVLTFKPALAPALTPVYAVAKGLLLGAISMFAESRYPGIVTQAVCLTFGTLFTLLLTYKSGMIPVTQNFRLGIVAATGGIFVFYLGAMIAQLMGFSTSLLTGSSPISLAISGVVVVIAALNLVLDFDFIENGAQRGNLPKYMEWYAAFGLLVTLVWLYIEILRLLMKLRDR